MKNAMPSHRLRLAAAVLVASTGMALAAELTRDDDGYLASTFGLAPQGDVLSGLTPAEQSDFHKVISSMTGSQRDDAVRDRLYAAHDRECDAWGQAHGLSGCGPAKDPAAQPGKDMADRICNDCHLFGTRLAPAFSHLAQQRDWDADAVGRALQHSHDMVPINLPPEERAGLAAYINSFR
jgi:cytochrome c5